MKLHYFSIVVGSLCMAASPLTAALNLTSTAFKDNGPIPMRYTCDGANEIPVLSWSDVPVDTKSFALIVDDPDAPAKVWVHWIVYNIPVTVRRLPSQKGETFPTGMNDFGNTNYGGPCPPTGSKPHHYKFTLYALDTMLTKLGTPTKAELLKAMEGHILARTTLVGTYARAGKK